MTDFSRPNSSVVTRATITSRDRLDTLLSTGDSSFSFEFFPPRDEDESTTLWRTIRRLEMLSPTFVSVTYGAGGSADSRLARTEAVTRKIVTDTTIPAVAHMTCIGASRNELRQVIGAYADAGIRNILALRGDPPGGPAAEWVQHPQGLRYAVELVEMLTELGDFCVGVAAFPYRHPASPDVQHDARVLAAKARAGAAFAITQMFFDSDAYFALVDRASAAGCDIPIVPGLMPITSPAQIDRMATLTGTPIPEKLRVRLDRVAGDPSSFRAVGVESTIEMASQLLQQGAPGLHFYTLNRSTATVEIYQALGL